MSPSPQEFLDALQDAVRSSGEAEWLAGRVDGDAIVVLFRRDDIRGADVSTGPIEGARLQFERLAQEVFGPGPHRLDDVLLEAKLEIVEPHELGARLHVSWADGLCADPASVLWRPDAVEAAAQAEPPPPTGPGPRATSPSEATSPRPSDRPRRR